MHKTTLIAAAAAMTLVGGHAAAEDILGLTTQNSITTFDSAAPGVSTGGGFVTGLVDSNEFLLALDYRAANATVYALSSTNNVYSIDQSSFAATFVGNLTANGDPALAGTAFAFDFNPAFSGGEFARIISDTDNNRVISGDTGTYLGPVEKTPVFYNAGDANDGADPNIQGIAYTNSFGVPASTQQYGIDATLGVLVTVANNAGTLDTVGSLGVSPLTNELGLDISGATGTAYASLQSGPNSALYTVDLNTGAATFVGNITSQDLIRDITVIPVPEPGSLALLGLGGLALLRRRR